MVYQKMMWCYMKYLKGISMPIQKWRVLDKIEMRDARWLAKDGWVKVQYMAEKYEHITIHATYNVYLDVFDDFKFI